MVCKKLFAKNFYDVIQKICNSLFLFSHTERIQLVEDCGLVDDIKTFGMNAVIDFQSYVCISIALELNKKGLCDFVMTWNNFHITCKLLK